VPIVVKRGGPLTPLQGGVFVCVRVCVCVCARERKWETAAGGGVFPGRFSREC